MRSNWRPLSCAILSTFFVLLLTACGLSGKSGLSAGADATVSIALTGPSTVTLGGQSQYAATVTGSSDASVTWSVNGVAGGNASVGSISSQGLYLAPASAPQSSGVTITATSVASPTASQSLAVALAAQPKAPAGASVVTLLLNGATSVTLGTSSQYAAIVTGTSDTAVEWSVNGVAGGNATVGFISATGLYAAPASAPSSSTVTITATSVGDPSASQSLAVALVASAGGGGGSAVTLALSGPTKVTLATSAHYAATVTGSSDTAVTWSVDGVVGGDTTLGSISNKGTYTAPANEPKSSKVTITATSMADPSVSQSLAVTLAAPANNGGGSTVTLTLSGATSVTLGTSSQYAATVTGSSNTGVTWRVNGIVGGDTAYGFISTKGRYTSPAKTPGSSKVTITATSLADPSIAQSLAITLTTPPTPPGGGGPVTLTLTGATRVVLGSSSQYAATVSGSANTAVKWSVNGIAGGNATDGNISAGGLYTAPRTAPQPSTVTIAATSVADPTVAKSLVTTLVPPTGTSRIPSNAISSGVLDGSSRWQWNHDPGTPGSSQGSSVYPVSGLSPDNAAREYYMTYSGRSGEIYHLSFAKDLNATHFVYDAYVYVVDPSQLANLEMDMNDVMANGKTVILGTQCSTYSKSWEYTYYSGGFHWHASNIPCDPKTWSAKTWHHIQIASHRDSNGIATYDWVGVDGVYNNFQNATVNSAASLGWALGDLLINFQIDGASAGSGSNTLYTDKLIVYRW
ncbi:MAG: trimeric autotransporter adhesin [Acidobacteriaceae bacterium]|nr:trimeric autotransporter adhesin [Acidobacteriaceae bacterium]